MRTLALVLALIGLASPAAAAPQPSGDAAGVAGAWDLVLDGTHRKCRLVLGIAEQSGHRTVRFPAGCRRALPILGQIGSWTAQARGAVRLLDREGEPALEFRREAASGVLFARAGDEAYRLEQGDRPARAGRAATPVALGVPQPTPVDLAKAPPLSALPGTYVIDRYTERDVCRVALGTAMLTAAGRFEARVIEGCRDAGLATFDPVAWRYEGGRLTLVARRGHEVTLISERQGQWRRDPEVGSTLVLRRAD